ncbi:oxidoreductase molybdopterin binding protein [Desulfurococcus mucosus DSM 2162]|uniref:Oxidoreductase molybdopterin binding protein n=1 Tax=Desulfurococcus mucosus (strain ATCC 35584 / DSM 2162 / JCM 9187 / O7/1) TaxID=765177 RepID=E8R9T3_DESM0|nr:oxidoreductase molybdopterin binding protein [Desulfurococcus mucosus DSM 2162]
MKCYATASEGLRVKGVEIVVDCAIDPIAINGVDDVRRLASEYSGRVLGGVVCRELVFDSNEAIGSTHMLYRFRCIVDKESGEYIGVRVVARGRLASRVLFTVPRKLTDVVNASHIYNPFNELGRENIEGGDAPGQTYIPSMVVYNILGVPSIDVAKWSLEVAGLVDNPLKLTLSSLYELGVKTVRRDFHCVTGWSVRNVEFTGVPLSRIIELVKPGETVKWVFVESVDGYSTIIPFEELTGGDALVALEMDGRPLDLLHGYPARLVVPHLYGWKSAKWLSRIVFMNEYRDGYWEALGYHPRGRVGLEERFKTH